MTEKKTKPEKNRGDTMMAIGVVMIVASILLPMVGLALDETTNMVLLLGGLAVAIVGWSVRSNLRRKATAKPKSVKNRGVGMMAIGVLMVLASIIFPVLNVALGQTMTLVLVVGGLAIAVVGWILRSRSRKKAAA